MIRTLLGVADGSLPVRARARAILASGCLLLASALGGAGPALAAGGLGLETADAGAAMPLGGPFELAGSGASPFAVPGGGLPTGLPGFGSSLGDVQGARLALLEVAPRLGDMPLLAEQADPAERVVIKSPIISGLAWRSGASCSDSSFGAWRGRPMDVNMVFVGHDTWADYFKRLEGAYFRGRISRAPQNVVSLAMMPRTERKQHAACAAGKFDSYFRQFGTLLVRAGAGDAVIRLGWEANAGSDSHEWGIDGPGDFPDYKKCFQRQVTALRSTAPSLLIEWTNAKKGGLPVSVMESYPGDPYVDLFGVHHYDSGPRKSSQKIWDEYVGKTYNGGPWGLNEWIKTAKSHGMKLGMAEWGVWNNSESESPDNPLYIENMYKFFKTNAADIAYENYYNCGESLHSIFPSNRFPKAAAKYRELWSAGQ